jgi:hypothetical protein
MVASDPYFSTEKFNFSASLISVLLQEEMVEMLKSVFRMDEDQCERRIARKYFEVNDPDYYEYESMGNTYTYIAVLQINSKSFHVNQNLSFSVT